MNGIGAFIKGPQGHPWTSLASVSTGRRPSLRKGTESHLASSSPVVLDFPVSRTEFLKHKLRTYSYGILG